MENLFVLFILRNKYCAGRLGTRENGETNPPLGVGTAYYSGRGHAGLGKGAKLMSRRVQTILPVLKKLVSLQDNQTADRELLKRFSRERDETAFSEIVRRHGPMLVRVCQRVVHNAQDAEDICQAAFLLLAQKATAVHWCDSVAGWLFQTAYRMSLKARARASCRKRHETRAKPRQPADPVAELTVRELQAVLDDELSRLPEKYRAPI